MEEHFFKDWQIQKIYFEDKNFPEILKKIKNPPKVLYFMGKIFPKENCFAIVGTRNCSDYGKTIAFNFAKDLSLCGLTIVSGLARGIDTFAHLGAIEIKKRTIAILGTGLDEKSFYPKTNLKLAKKILELGGCLISEYPPGQMGTKYTFPQRNRIISGISLGALIIEAKIKSGALITGNFAKKQGRKLFAIPGSIFSKNSQGCHFLIKKGAILAENPNDILKELNIKISKRKKIEQNLSKEEKAILDILASGPKTIEEILEKTKIDLQKVLTILSIFEIDGKVKNIGNDVFSLN
ncbi:MAG: DNA-processing protein DprA [Minisyncoccia bacterium]